MRFGVFAPQGWRLDLVGIEPADQWPTILDFARTVEAGPWESIWVYDHFHTVPVPTEEACHEAWSLVAALSATTRRLRIGQMCTCMAYRNPAYLAKVAATCDVISGRRVEMGPGELMMGEDQNTKERDGKKGHLSGTVGDEPCTMIVTSMPRLTM